MRTRFNRTLDIRRTILIADDEMINRQILIHNLGRFYDTIEAATGRETLEKIREHKADLSLIMLDLNMPDGTGYDVLREMQEDEEIKRIPVIVLTSEAQAEIESLQLGAVDFLEKGKDMPEVVVARVKRSIELAEDTMIIRSTEDDELTGLYNRKYFFEYAKLLRRSDPEQEMDAIAMNVERFHIVNEIYGRQFGDTVLIKLADIARKILNISGGLAARSEADTFFIYCRHLEDHELLQEIIREGLQGMEHAAKVRVRVGVYPKAPPEISLEDQFDRALSACHSIRNDLTRQIACYDEALHEEQMFEERLVGDFEQAVSEDQISVYFQPQFLIPQESQPILASAEALVRWDHPELGQLRPNRFVPTFERNGLISRLDHQVWRKAAQHMRAWKERYGMTYPISINISRIDLFDDELEDTLSGLIEEFGLDPSEYRLEITESAYAEDSRQLAEKIQRLKDRGFTIEMDDFGSGYSSLNALTELPLDVLKMDIKFARQLTGDQNSHKMISIIMEIAEWLSASTIAEGIETEEQLNVFRSLGCDLAQGYYFSKPLTAEEFEALFCRYLPKEGKAC